MKAYILTKEPFPNGMAATNRIKCYAKAIISQGVEVEVVNYTRTEALGKIKNKEARGVFEGIHFRYIGGTSVRKKNEMLNKIIGLKDRFALLRYISNNTCNGDVVIGFVGSDVNFINRVINTTHKHGGKYVRELCELPAGTGVETQKTQETRNLIYNKQFPICDGFLAISEALVEVAKQHKSTKGKIVKIPILVDYEKYELADRSQETDVPYIFHSGTLSEQKDGFLGMIESFGLACKKTDKNIRFVSTGTVEKCPQKKDLFALIEKYNIKDRVEFTGYLSENELKEHLSKASLTIINKYDTQQNQYCFSTKLGEYLAAGKPVIITDVGEATHWLTNKENAMIVEAGNVEAMADVIAELFNDNDNRIRIGENGRKLCKEVFAYPSQSESLIEFLSNL